MAQLIISVCHLFFTHKWSCAIYLWPGIDREHPPFPSLRTKPAGFKLFFSLWRQPDGSRPSDPGNEDGVNELLETEQPEALQEVKEARGGLAPNLRAGAPSVAQCCPGFLFWGEGTLPYVPL